MMYRGQTFYLAGRVWCLRRRMASAPRHYQWHTNWICTNFRHDRSTLLETTEFAAVSRGQESQRLGPNLASSGSTGGNRPLGAAYKSYQTSKERGFKLQGSKATLNRGLTTARPAREYLLPTAQYSSPTVQHYSTTWVLFRLVDLRDSWEPSDQKQS